MQTALLVAGQLGAMLIMMLTGVAMTKLGKLNKDGARQISNVIFYITMPALSLSSLQRPFDSTEFTFFIICFALATVLQLLAGIVGGRLLKKTPHPQLNTLAVVFSNSAFIGFPVLAAAFGDGAVFYGVAYATSFSLLSATYGTSLLTKGEGFSVKKALLSPLVIATTVAIILYAFGVQLPSVLDVSADFLSAVNTPLSMVMLGVNIANLHPMSMIKKLDIWLVTLARNVVFPIVALVLLLPTLLFDSSYYLPIACTLTSFACPCAAVVLTLANVHKKDTVHASGLLAVTTVVSLVTVPLFAALLKVVFSL